MKRLNTVFIMLFVFLSSFSQEKEDTINLLLDKFLFGSSLQDSVLEAIILNAAEVDDILNIFSDSRIIYLRSEYENKTYFSGQDIGNNQFNVANQFLYLGPKGLSIGYAGIIYDGFKPKYNTSIVSVGYNKKLSFVKHTSIRAGYNRFFFAETDSASFNSSVNAGTTYQLKYIGTSTDLSLLLGNDPSVQFSWDLFGDIPLLRIGLFDKLTLEPEVSLYFGNGIIKINEIIDETHFGLINTVLRIPLNLSYRNFDFRAGYNFNFPRIPGDDNKPENTSFFNIAIGYIISF